MSCSHANTTLDAQKHNCNLRKHADTTHNLTQFKLSRRHANSTLRRKYSRDFQQEMGKLGIYISYMMNYILIVIHVSLQLNIEIFKIQAK